MSTTEEFTDIEKAAMKERAKELKAEKRANKKREAGEQAVLEKIAELSEPERSMAAKVHAIITTAAPDLWPKTWYGMPAYARDGNVVCFYQSAEKFETRYATLGFSDVANLDDGEMWPVSFALNELTAGVEEKIASLVERAVNQAST